ncbi:adenylyl-sulfate kinase [Trinickia terrae]|uniref:Adenylyl-sulfate kinase n=1 Tax=Trinickia terrae TaxID=2571161 RepID=A0A4U1HX52_9BURK|nr:adenylyl-sulfate kinase [Trinickia terrae]TKC83586.1 adenylyl-sulfate kinase [Trinickia terrae]
MSGNVQVVPGLVVPSGDEARAPVKPDAEHHRPGAPSNVFWHGGGPASEMRPLQFGHPPVSFWLTGLSGAGKSTIAFELEQRLRADGRPCTVLDGDNLRYGLNCDLGFSEDDRRENIRRTGEVARLMNDAGLIVIASLISPYRKDRATAQRIIGEDRFIEVHVSTPLEVCVARDPKGLYKKARQGEIRHFTGVTSPYEPPLAPSVVVDTSQLAHGGAAAELHAYLIERERCEGKRHAAAK